MEKGKKPLIAKVTKAQFIDAYLRLWNGGFKMTEKEIEIVKYILQFYEKVSNGGVREPYLSEIVFSSKHVSILKKECNLTKQGWNNYKKTLVLKKVLIEHDDVIFINPMLIPRTEITFKFII